MDLFDQSRPCDVCGDVENSDSRTCERCPHREHCPQMCGLPTTVKRLKLGGNVITPLKLGLQRI